MTQKQLFVGNLPFSVSWQNLKDLFREAGTIIRADVSISPTTGRSRGFGTLTFSTDEEALKAIDLFNNYEWHGRRIEVREDWAATGGSALVLDGAGQGKDDDASGITTRSLYIGNLPYSAQWQEVKDVFRQYGTVVRAEIPQDYSGNSRGFAIVLMETVEDAKKAYLSLNGTDWMGRPLEIRGDNRPYNGNHGPSNNGAQYSKGSSSGAKRFGQQQVQQQLQVQVQQHGNGEDGMGQVQAQFSSLQVQDVLPRTAPQPPTSTEEEAPLPGTVLFIGNIPYALTAQDLKTLFSEAGSVVRCDIARDATSRSRGFGQVVMSSLEEAQLAIETLNGRDIEGRVLDVREDKFGSSRPLVHPPGAQLFISNLPYTLRWQDLKDIFRENGFTPMHAEVLIDGPSGRSKGVGVVRLGSRELAEKAIVVLNGMEVSGRNITVRLDKFS